MKIRLNDEVIELHSELTVEQLLEQLNRLQPGTALAINHTIIPRDNWAQQAVHDGDDILLFQAIAGG
ncbi:thiamine biosynthesis protein ThiS [Dickeya chrysanthemi Ech1591]|uniref:Thiamine biosynthesis protein ThiS n=1 Tax=Dickeya chrysanthemi (strain Ech1591) TaxID=561229 RepID=C6CN80_DICC1|nr:MULTISPECIES: sulfur carrier protein ThiS [Dickeya]ACT08673.1 thiamine biosynthesis protein ThiS [Dickeya chrysanthemi Ech1591]TYL40891.1 sulfur carrier protein ThiS [Dickeya sp. ws52]WJM84869.1 sulfur carrier protein ThiS [Dickeya chrysanthemi]